MKYWILTIALLILFSPALAVAQANSAEKLELVSYDSLRQKNAQGGLLRELVGNVHLRQGSAEMYCQRVKWWVDTDEVIIERDVRIYDASKEMLADIVYYFIATKMYRAVGRVQLKDSTNQVTAARITYFKNEDQVMADSQVVMTDFKNNFTIYGQRAEIDNVRDYAKVTGEPILIKKDSTGAEEFRITSSIMEMFERGEKAVVSDSVTITHKKAVSTCGKAEYYRRTNEILLDKNPTVTQGGDFLSGDLIHLFIKDRALVKAIVKNRAMVTSVVDTTQQKSARQLNKLTGQVITMFFEDEQLQQAIVEKQATSYYHVFEDNDEKGLNKIIGDKITMFFRDREIIKIIIESNPQLSSGIFYPVGKVPPGEDF
ncbi:MAG: OstA-like protein [Candidatus Zhuqueibacterota bacterium]